MPSARRERKSPAANPIHGTVVKFFAGCLHDSNVLRVTVNINYKLDFDATFCEGINVQ